MFKKSIFNIVIAILILLFSDVLVIAHSGRTDKYGGHYDRKTGVYHFHNSGSVGSIRSVQLQRTTSRKSITQDTTSGSQSPDVARAIIDAKTDVQEPYAWAVGSFLTAAACGCLGGSVVILSSQIIEPSPPIHRLIGKSPEYVAQYTNTYEKEVKNKRLLYTGVGCLGGSIVAGLFWSQYYSNVY